jgi:predicted ATPase/class 3 adenylate cyclase
VRILRIICEVAESAALPSGRVTFCFTDIEASTRTMRAVGERFVELLDVHGRIVRSAAARHGGSVVHTEGDSFFIAYPDAHAGVLAAIEMQQHLSAYDWPDGGEIRVRIGLHYGDDIVPVAGDYVALSVNQAARISAAGHGGQILLSQALVPLVVDRLPADIELARLGEFRLKDFDEPVALYELRGGDLPAGFPPPRAPRPARHRLPRQRTSFIGRDRDLESLRGLISDAPLVTLTGPGGVGKTRLAIELASTIDERYPDGVWFADLSPLSNPDLVPSVVASAVGVTEDGDQPLLDRLLATLDQKRSLLVLDNCEHVIDAAADLADALLAGADGLTLLATSREALRIDGEQIWPVGPLSLPAEDEVPLESLVSSDGVRLFVERAARAQPGFTLDEITAPAVYRVCRQLDGLPLATELAAARVGTMSVTELANRLGDRFPVLTTGMRTAPPRQQSLQSIVEWSYDLLSEREQALFRRLAVFSGGFTLEAAESVVSSDPYTSSDVADSLAHLVEQSLVETDGDPVSARYRMLVTVWMFAQEKLEESGELQEIRRRHFQWYLALTQRGDAALATAEQAEWLDRLELEHDNIRAALAWITAASGASAEALRLATAAGEFRFIRGYNREATADLERVLANAGSGTDVEVGYAQLVLGRYMSQTQDADGRGQVLLAASLATFEAADDPSGQASCLLALGENHRHAGRFDDARASLSRCLLIATAEENLPMVALATARLAYVEYSLEDNVEAEALARRSLSIAQEISDNRVAGIALHCLTLIACAREEYAAAVEFGSAARARFRTNGDRRATAVVSLALGAANAGLGRLDLAALDLNACLDGVVALGDSAFLPEVLLEIANLAALTGRVDESASLLGACAHARRAVNVPAVEPEKVLEAAVRELLTASVSQDRLAELEQMGAELHPSDVIRLAREVCEGAGRTASV